MIEVPHPNPFTYSPPSSTRPAAPWYSPSVDRTAPIGLVLRVKVAKDIAQWCLMKAPQEACGMLVAHAGDGRVRFIPIPNVHPSPTHHYRFDENRYIVEMAELHQTGEEILGLVHSHPHGPPHPSNEDRRLFPLDHPLHYLVMELEPASEERVPNQFRSNSLTSWRFRDNDFVREQVLFV